MSLFQHAANRALVSLIEAICEDFYSKTPTVKGLTYLFMSMSSCVSMLSRLLFGLPLNLHSCSKRIINI